MSAEHTEHSPTLGALAKALAAAQSEMEHAPKAKRNPHTGSWYADLATVLETAKGPLAKNGLSVVQTTEPHGLEAVCVVTWLLHESNEWICGRLVLPCIGLRKKDGTVLPVDAQTFGSALTYARRYAYAAIIGLAPIDDDGNAASAQRYDAPKGAAKPPTVASSVDVDGLVKAFESAKDQKEFGAASLAVGRAKDKLSDADLERLREVHDRRLRELSQTEAA